MILFFFSGGGLPEESRREGFLILKVAIIHALSDEKELSFIFFFVVFLWGLSQKLFFFFGFFQLFD